MSGIDKDPKSKVSQPSEKKFVLGFSDGFVGGNIPMIIALVNSTIRRKK